MNLSNLLGLVYKAIGYSFLRPPIVLFLVQIGLYQLNPFFDNTYP